MRFGNKKGVGEEKNCNFKKHIFLLVFSSNSFAFAIQKYFVKLKLVFP
jgi:hypothetical protein